MKRQRKRVFGLFGLVLVAVMTFFAAHLPSPGASALSDITDTIIVRVVGDTPDVTINAPVNGAIFLDPEQMIKIYRENVHTVEFKLTYINVDGEEQTDTIAKVFPDYDPGENNVYLNLDDYGGYGNFTLTVIGTGYDGVKDTEIVEFSYEPLTASIVEDEETGLPYIVVDYDENKVSKMVSYVYYNGQIVTPPSPIIINAPDKKALLDLEGKPEGIYTIKTIAYDLDGKKIDRVIINTYERKLTPVPDTGGLFKNLNISREDSLITGAIAFFGFAIMALWIVVKGKRDNRKRR
ncbi:hypothetical protein IKG28_00575 [Candidatus Saccharibacteria bacterium]|nr:hypothetical protein [Candidatus Saccharibacteria bacterium]